jgi:hypothetical protein
MEYDPVWGLRERDFGWGTSGLIAWGVFFSIQAISSLADCLDRRRFALRTFQVLRTREKAAASTIASLRLWLQYLLANFQGYRS